MPLEKTEIDARFDKIMNDFNPRDPDERVVIFRWVHAVQRTPGTTNQVTVLVEMGNRTLRFAAKAGQFKEDQFIVMFLPNAFLPADAHPVFKSMQPQHCVDGVLGVKVNRNIEHGGLFTDGIIMPFEALPELANLHELAKLRFDDLGGWLALDLINILIDLEDFFGVKRWIPPTQTPTSMGACPRFYKKTKINRLRDCPNLFKKSKYKHLIYQVSGKMDGSSMAVYFISKSSPLFKALNPLPADPGPHMEMPNGRIGVCSMNIELPQRDDCPYWRAALSQDLPAILSQQNEDCVIQGELVGDGINGNRHGYSKGMVDFFVFDIYEPLDEADWLPARQVEDWCKTHRVQHVPVLAYEKLRPRYKSREEIQAAADSVEGEGLVFKCLQEPGRRFKVHNQRYLAFHGLE